MRRLRPLLAALCCAVLGSAGAQTIDKLQPAGKDGIYEWYDGGQVRRVVIDPAHVAEFGQRLESASTPVAKANGVRIWRRDDSAAARAGAEGNASPVFRSADGGGMRALPGNVIVKLDPSWHAGQVASWLSANGLREVRRLPLGGNVLVVASPPGLESLALANRLQQSGSVVSAQPDWWEQTEAR